MVNWCCLKEKKKFKHFNFVLLFSPQARMNASDEEMLEKLLLHVSNVDENPQEAYRILKILSDERKHYKNLKSKEIETTTFYENSWIKSSSFH